MQHDQTENRHSHLGNGSMSKLRIYSEVEERVTVDVDVGEVLDNLTAKEKREVVMYLEGAMSGSSYDPDFVRRAYDALIANRPQEAAAYLERAIFGRVPVAAVA